MRAWLVLAIIVLAGCTTVSDEAPRHDTSSGQTGSDDSSHVGGTAGGGPGEGSGGSGGSGPSGGSGSGSGSGEPSGNQTSPGNQTGNPGHGQNGTEPEPNGTRPFEPQGTNQPCNSLTLVTPEQADPAGLVNGWPLLRLDVAVIADPYFVENNPNNWTTLLRDLVLDANPYYEDQIGIRLVPIIIDDLPPGTLDKSADPDRIWDTARGFMAANYPDSTHDFVAVILGEDYNDTTAGQVNCVSGAHHPDAAYLWSEYNEPRGPGYDDYLGTPADIFLDIPLKVFMHEAAHLLAAHHHYSNCGESMANYAGASDALAMCGVMINDIGLASFTFSSYNRLTMRSFVEDIGIGTPV